jgi:ubiquinone/menaquinone biosynthesis C-methylase UbiE
MSYVIKGGQQGSDRLAVIADALRQTTAQLLDRAGSLAGATIVDAACGGGHVALELAERVGPRGHVFGFDLDAVKLDLAAALANERALSNITFMRADVLDAWPVDGVDLVYARFILTHLQQPETCLARAKAALRAGGRLVVEDIDIEGRFSDPPCAALDRADVLYIEAVRRQGGDPLIGRRLHRLVEGAGFEGVQIGLVQPFAR